VAFVGHVMTISEDLFSYVIWRHVQSERTEPNWNAGSVALHGLYKANEVI